MNEEEYEECLENLEDGLIEDLKEERRIDPHVKVPTKAQQKKIIKIAHANYPNIPPCELNEEFEEAWEQVQKEAKIAADKRAAKKAAKSGSPPPEPKKKDPHVRRTMGWRKCFLKVREGSDGASHHGVLQPFFKTPTNEQVLAVIQALDRKKPSWDAKIHKSKKQSDKAVSLFANMSVKMFPELIKEKKNAKKKSAGCLIVLVPLIGAVYFVCSYLVRFV